MSRPRGRPPKPVEEKRRLGNPGGRRLPPRLTALPTLPREVPTPDAPLGKVGLALWHRTWTSGAYWLRPEVDCVLVQMLCEGADEHAALRYAVLKDGHWRDRHGLRQLGAQMAEWRELLGMTPTGRARLGVSVVSPPPTPTPSPLDDMTARRRPKPSA